MKFALEFYSEAQAEYTESVLWYQERREGLGGQFFEAVEKKLKLLTQKPEIFPFEEFPIRKVVLKHFPFIIFYKFNVSLKQIYVIGIFHTKSNPKVLRKRI